MCYFALLLGLVQRTTIAGFLSGMFLGAIYGVVVPSLIFIATIIYLIIFRPVPAPSFSDLLLLGLGILSAFLFGGAAGIFVGFFAGAVIGLISGIILGLIIFRQSFVRGVIMKHKKLRITSAVFCSAFVVFGTAFGILMVQRQETPLILFLFFIFLVLIPALLASFGASKRTELIQDWYNENVPGAKNANRNAQSV